ncbi:hypothetical protein B0T17DRAFT_535861 [Bombardia bombarda]|uniref:Uncharacterized protein n=1 Tax=Bombardia bombarda TaxID=252184 RepID=A0AA39WLV3_9PEZI|nr:hypothetical protein B0T17DRAFT_535861 [Bombardia bombarda]
MACVEDLLYADNGPTDDYYAAETFTKQVRNQMGALKASIDSRIGFTCCGQPTNLGQFMQCMRPAVARTLWLCERWASTPLENRRACGWPDCRQFLPWECAWTDHKASDLRRWYCWQCKGNSVDAGHCLTETQECFPYLPEGQPALKPGR